MQALLGSLKIKAGGYVQYNFGVVHVLVCDNSWRQLQMLLQNGSWYCSSGPGSM